MVDSWLLAGGRVARGALEAIPLDLEILAGRITAIRPSIRRRAHLRTLDLRGCLILPGLINAHDHLEFNLFPRLGRGPYPNAGEWARDIYHPRRSPLKEHLSIPMEARLRWGAVKNLLSGATTVCHHNPYNARVFVRDFAVRVPRRIGWAHSLEFSQDLVQRFKRTPAGWPFVVHLGEAVDRGGREELLRLDALGARDDRTVLVHAVALGRQGLQLARDRGAALVWCPSSNIFILGRTLRRAALEYGIPVALGTDSALSGQGDLLEEMRLARRLAGVSAARLFEMVTRDAACIMRLRRGEGSLTQGGTADLLVVRDCSENPAARLLRLRSGEMELVFIQGEVKLASAEYSQQLAPGIRRSLRPLILAGKERRLVYLAADLPGLFRQTEPVLGSVNLAHKRVLRPS